MLVWNNLVILSLFLKFKTLLSPILLYPWNHILMIYNILYMKSRLYPIRPNKIFFVCPAFTFREENGFQRDNYFDFVSGFWNGLWISRNGHFIFYSESSQSKSRDHLTGKSFGFCLYGYFDVSTLQRWRGTDSLST